MGQTVAVEGDVKATPGSTPYPPADSGTWTAGPVEYQAYDNFKVKSKAVVYQAKCKFTFSGVNSASGVTVSGEETVELKAQQTKLQQGQKKVLVDGDMAMGTYQNQLQAVAMQKLTTA